MMCIHAQCMYVGRAANFSEKAWRSLLSLSISEIKIQSFNEVPKYVNILG